MALSRAPSKRTLSVSAIDISISLPPPPELLAQRPNPYYKGAVANATVRKVSQPQLDDMVQRLSASRQSPQLAVYESNLSLLMPFPAAASSNISSNRGGGVAVVVATAEQRGVVVEETTTATAVPPADSSIIKVRATDVSMRRKNNTKHELSHVKVLPPCKIDDATDRLYRQELLFRRDRQNQLRMKHLGELIPRRKINVDDFGERLQRLYYHPLEKIKNRYPKSRRNTTIEEETSVAEEGGGGVSASLPSPKAVPSYVERLYGKGIEQQKGEMRRLVDKYAPPSTPPLLPPSEMARSIERLYSRGK